MTTSGNMEHPLWKKIQNDPTFLKYLQANNTGNQNATLTSSSNGNTNGSTSGSLANGMYQQQFSQAAGVNELNMNALGSLNNANLSLLLNDPNALSGILNGQQGNAGASSLSPISPVLNQISPTYRQQQQMKLNQLMSLNNGNSSSSNDQQFLYANANGNNRNSQHIDQNTINSFNQMLMDSSNKKKMNISNQVNENMNDNMNEAVNNNNNYLNYESMLGINGSNGSNASKRELGMIQNTFNTYGFIKCLNRDLRLFFHNSSVNNSNGTELNIGDLVEFEESFDKRNGKPIALNIIKYDVNEPNKLTMLNKQHQQGSISQQQSIDSSLNLMNLKELLLVKNNGNANSNNANSSDGSSNGRNTPTNSFNQQQQSYHYLMNGLKMLNIQQHGGMLGENTDGDAAKANNLNSIINLLNMNGTNLNNNGNLLNLVKNPNGRSSSSSGTLSPVNNINDPSNKNNELISNEVIEGTVAIAAIKRQITNNNMGMMTNGGIGSTNLEGRITYQRNGETFYIPYSLNDVVNSSNAILKMGDRVKFCISHAFNNNGPNGQMPVVTTYARRVQLVQSPASSMLSLNNNSSNNMITQQQQQLIDSLIFQQQQNNLMKKMVYRGIISSLKDSFGKIEREDLFKETFFHFTDYKGKNPAQELRLGLNVEFEIQDRYGKEIACNIRKLPEGSVCFDELSANIYVGRIIQPPTLFATNGNQPISIGRLIFDYNDDNLVELKFTDRDRISECGEYTLLEGDFVQFRIATDKRKMINATSSTSSKRATQISLIEEHSLSANSSNTKEHRERGILIKLFNGNNSNSSNDLSQHMNNVSKYGAIKSIEHDEIIYFSFSEVISYARFTSNINDVDDLVTSQSGDAGSSSSSSSSNSKKSSHEYLAYKVNQVKLEIGDSLEFSVIECQRDSIFKNGMKAIRICQLAKNTVKLHIIGDEICTGQVEKDAIAFSLDNSSTMFLNDNYSGLIRYDDKKATVAYNYYYLHQMQMDTNMLIDGENKNDDQSSTVNFGSYFIGDKIQFNISTCARTKKQYAVNIKLLESRKEQGFVTMLKDNYGFIEINILSGNSSQKPSAKSSAVSRDIFFHFSSLQFSVNDLDVGDEVEFSINRKNKQKLCAENLKKLSYGSIKPNTNYIVSPAIHKGKIIQALRSQNTGPNVNLNNINNQDQMDEVYYGKIQLLNENNKKDNSNSDSIYQFGIFSLGDKRLFLQNADLVTFQLIEIDGAKKAFNIQLQGGQQDQQSSAVSSRQRGDYKRGKVDSIKGHCGYIEYLVGNNGESKKLFFHISDVIDTSNGSNTQNGNQNDSSSSSSLTMLKPGDDVEFMVSHNPRNGKYSATRIKRTSSSSNSLSQLKGANISTASPASLSSGADAESKRPERLITKLKVANIDNASGKKLILTRQPNNPDVKSKSFSKVIKERLPGSLIPLNNTSDTTTTGSTKFSENSSSSIHQTPSSSSLQSMPIMDLLAAGSNANSTTSNAN